MVTLTGVFFSFFMAPTPAKPAPKITTCGSVAMKCVPFTDRCSASYGVSRDLCEDRVLTVMTILHDAAECSRMVGRMVAQFGARELTCPATPEIGENGKLR